MPNGYKTFIGCLLLWIATSVHAMDQPSAPERVLWQKRPIPVSLTVGQERMVHFPNSRVRYWLPSVLDNAVSILAVNGVLYITPHRNFQPTRIRVKNLTDHTIYLLDLMAFTEKTVAPELIVMDEVPADNQESRTNSVGDDATKPTSAFDWFIRLTRFAAQSLYAPERLLPADTDIYPVRLHTATPVPLVRGGNVEATPVKSWRGGGYYLTAVRLHNVTHQSLQILHQPQPNRPNDQWTLVLSQDLRGHWLAVTPQHTLLEAIGYQDVTTLYLLSERSFQESL